ncbi:MAG: hypothetical protein ACD_67C00211G0003 [uncultured bacterium]|nr:MAG: hypothetical protein ACD_67C00211G0003 [uncultured bacterium]
MSINKPKRIEEYLIFYLKKGPIKCLNLVTKIQEERPGTTKQAVYSALRQLRAEENIIIAKGFASLNIAWLNKMTSFFDLAKNNYIKNSNSGSFLDLEDNERIKYYFHTLQKADVFWTHAYYLLLERLKEHEPVFLYNPHEWFLLARTENELACVTDTIAKNHQFLVTSSSTTLLDKFVSRYFDGTKSQYNMLSKPMFKESNYYVNVFGDFLIEAWLDKNIIAEVENIYQTSQEFDDATKNAFHNVLDMEGRMRIVISRNHKKAERFKKSLTKGFAIKKERD